MQRFGAIRVEAFRHEMGLAVTKVSAEPRARKLQIGKASQEVDFCIAERVGRRKPQRKKRPVILALHELAHDNHVLHLIRGSRRLLEGRAVAPVCMVTEFIGIPTKEHEFITSGTATHVVVPSRIEFGPGTRAASHEAATEDFEWFRVHSD